MRKHRLIRRSLVGLGAAIGLGLSGVLTAADTTLFKVDIIHSLSGTMAISETPYSVSTMLMLIDEQNRKGGVLGKPL